MTEPDLQGQPERAPEASQDSGLPISPGARLAAYREERGWTVEQVASQLNLAPRQIAALENDDYSALPGMPIVRGFIRAYAKLLKVDSAPLLAGVGGETMLPQQPIAPMPSLATPFSETRLPTMVDRRPAISSKWMIGLLVVLLALAAIWAASRGTRFAWFPHRSTPPSASAPVPQSPGTTVTPLAPPATVARPPSEPTPSSAPAADTGMSAAPGGPALPGSTAGQQPTEPASGNATAPVEQPAADQSTAAPVPATAPATPVAPAAPPATSGALELKANQDSWVEVRQAQGNKVLLSRVLKPGESEHFDLDQPLTLVIGNAGGLDVSVRGKPLDVKSQAKTNVARLTVK